MINCQNWILRWVYEVNFFDTTNGFATISFLVLAAKPLVISKKFYFDDPHLNSILVAWYQIRNNDESRHDFVQLKIHSKPTPIDLFTAWKSFYGIYLLEALRRTGEGLFYRRTFILYITLYWKVSDRVR